VEWARKELNELHSKLRELREQESDFTSSQQEHGRSLARLKNELREMQESHWSKNVPATKSQLKASIRLVEEKQEFAEDKMDELTRKYSRRTATSKEGLQPSVAETEEERIMRVIHRGKSSIMGRKSTVVVEEPPRHVGKGTQKSLSWKEKQREAEEERQKQRAKTEENLRRAEENEQKAEAFVAPKTTSTAIPTPTPTLAVSGIPTTFVCDGIMDFDATVHFCGTLTGGKEVLVPLDENSMEFKITLPAPPGVHYYRFKVYNKWQIDKTKPTGIDPILADLANKIEIS